MAWSRVPLISRSSAGKVLPGAPALLLIAVALWEVAAAWRADREVPSDDAWREAAKLVRDGYRAGDLIVFAPEWIDPVGRMHLGDMVTIEMAARMDGARYGRIWEVSIRGARAPETAGLEPVSTAQVRGVAVRRFERAPVVVLDDLLAHQPTSDGVLPTLELAEVGFSPHRCFEVTPQPGHPVRMTFSQIRLGTALVGYVGLADVFTRRDVRDPGTLTVEIAGRPVVAVRSGVDDGWVRFEATTTPGVSDVVFVASAAAPQRQICFAAEARR